MAAVSSSTVTTAASAARPAHELRVDVIPADLRCLPVLHEILGLLADPAVSAAQLGAASEKIPVLANRLRVEAKNLGRVRRNAGEAIVFLGNRGFESVLLTLLEDLTVLRADVDPMSQFPEMTFF